jgi:hypothetical protein
MAAGWPCNVALSLSLSLQLQRPPPVVSATSCCQLFQLSQPSKLKPTITRKICEVNCITIVHIGCGKQARDHPLGSGCALSSTAADGPIRASPMRLVGAEISI